MVALVDVLELTYGVVNQMGSVQTSAAGAGIWQNFWYVEVEVAVAVRVRVRVR